LIVSAACTTGAVPTLKAQATGTTSQRIMSLSPWRRIAAGSRPIFAFAPDRGNTR
jgi:hypothetical protein